MNEVRAINAAFEQSLEQNLASDRLLHFTQSQLSLALSIQKSRPANISTRDYCLQLRKHIKLGKSPNEEERRYIDTAEFWKDQYSTLYLEKQQLAARVAQLELLAKHDSGSDEATPLRQEDRSSFENMVPSFLVAPAERHISRRSTIGQSSILVKGPEAPNSLSLLKQALILRRLLQDVKAPADVLLSAILSLLSSMIATIKETCANISQEMRRNESSDDVYALHTFNMTAAAFNICLKGLENLNRDIPGRRCKGQAIYALVHFYKTCLSQLDELCMQEASYEQSQTGQNEIQGFNTDFLCHRPRSGSNAGYVEFLIKLLRCPELQMEHPVYTEVIEGFLSTLLEATGSHLSQTIFGERLSTSEMLGRVPGVPTDTSCPVTRGRAAEMAGRQLVLVLKRATECRSDEQKQALARILGGSRDSCTTLATPTILMRARQRLQETLLKAVFGDDGRDFLNALKMPQSMDGWNRDSSQVAEVHEGTFVEAVWSVVGWDLILSV